MEPNSFPTLPQLSEPGSSTDQCPGLFSRKRREQRRYNDPLAKQFENQRPRNFPRYFKIKSVTGESLAEIDVIKANKQLEECILGKAKKITEMKSGQLLVEVSSEQQGMCIKSLKRLQCLQELSLTVHRSIGIPYCSFCLI